jgi:hypothetical protein
MKKTVFFILVLLSLLTACDTAAGEQALMRRLDITPIPVIPKEEFLALCEPCIIDKETVEGSEKDYYLTPGNVKYEPRIGGYTLKMSIDGESILLSTSTILPVTGVCIYDYDTKRASPGRMRCKTGLDFFYEDYPTPSASNPSSQLQPEQ